MSLLKISFLSHRKKKVDRVNMYDEANGQSQVTYIIYMRERQIIHINFLSMAIKVFIYSDFLCDHRFLHISSSEMYINHFILLFFSVLRLDVAHQFTGQAFRSID